MAFHTWPLLHCVSAVWILIKLAERKHSTRLLLQLVGQQIAFQLSQRTVMTKHFDDYTPSAGGRAKVRLISRCNWNKLDCFSFGRGKLSILHSFARVSPRQCKSSNDKRSSEAYNRWKCRHVVSKPRLVELCEGFRGQVVAISKQTFGANQRKRDARLYKQERGSRFSSRNSRKWRKMFCIKAQHHWCEACKHFP